MSKRLIYEEDAIDAVAEGLKRTFVEYRDVAEKMLNNVPSAPKQRLIPCEKCWHGCPFPIHTEGRQDADSSGNMSGTQKALKHTETHDLVSRQSAIDSVCEVCEYCEYFKNEKLIQTIKDLPSAQPRWIPVTEVLPDRGKTVLITNDKGNVRSGRFRGVELWKDDGVAYWTFKGNTVEHVLAWLPLPEPYAERGQQDVR